MPFWTLRRRVVAVGVGVIALAFGWAAVVVAVAVASVRDQATTADAIAVLGAAQYNGRPSPVFRARLDHAATLYQRGLAPVVLVTGGVGSRDTISESEVGRRYLVKAGLPEGAVVALPAGESTAASLHGVAQWFAGKDSRRVLLVSDGFHMLRLQILATRLGLAGFTSPAPNSPIRANPRRNAAYFLAEGFKVPITWVFNR
ncbi:MAG TPA: YdcF family protein [Gemmatimonadales bacterium]|nr:YdcF family protein [Gemmatimonadales bacterium]